MAITKSFHWKYEEEIRVFAELHRCRSRNGFFFEPLSCKMRISGMVLGPLCDLSEALVQKALPKGRSVEIAWARLAFNSFSVVPNKAKTRKAIHGK